MSGYVGIDVHRKRSQVAVVTEDGQVQLNKNVVNGSEPFLRLIGDLPAGTPVAFEAAFGWSWLADLLEDYGFDAHLVHLWVHQVHQVHLWVPKTYATWADALGIAVGSVKRLGVGRAGLGSAGGGMIFGLWA
jgi:hypothetical protein